MDNENMIRLAWTIDENTNEKVPAITTDTFSNGPGVRAVVWTQGCIHNCKGCHNPETHDPLGGTWVSIDDIVRTVKSNKLLTGVTFSGGDPFMQAGKMARLAERLKAEGYDIMVYTGYTYERLIKEQNEDNHFLDLLKAADTLVDGPFVESLKDTRLLFRGSSNQRILDPKMSLELGMPIAKDLNDHFTDKFQNKYVRNEISFAS